MEFVDKRGQEEDSLVNEKIADKGQNTAKFVKDEIC